jgi:regulator of RNase E activity RraA
MEKVTIEQAWGVLRENGYHNQYAGDWKKIHEDRPVVGRALTAQYMPRSPGLEERLAENGRANGHSGPTNTWPIEMLEPGDVYVADGFGKVKDGTLIGDNLGTAIYANSGNGVVFNGSLRDLSGLEEIDGFNAFVRDWHPSFIQEMMLTGINEPIRIGRATVLPGDVVLAKREGVVFIPAHLAREVVRTAELTLLRDQFGKQRIREGTYTSGQIDSEWTDAITADFYDWLRQNEGDLPVPPEQVRRIIEEKPL